MFKEYLIQTLAANYENKIMIFDFESIEGRYSYSELLSGLGFQILRYDDATEFRAIYQNELKERAYKVAVVVEHEQYVPYDIRQSFYCIDLGWTKLFPNLNSDVLIKDKTLDLTLLYGAYHKLYKNLSVSGDTTSYVINNVYGKENVAGYIQKTRDELIKSIEMGALNYNYWTHIAAKKGKTEYLAAKSGIDIDFSFIDEAFKKFVFNEYRSLSGIIQKDSPIMVSRVMDYVAKKNEKIALIVLDGMSIFDFNGLASEFVGIDYQEKHMYALIPTTTAISRQSLLSGKFPVELDKPFNLSREEKEFVQKAKALGYLEQQICYARGYDLDIGPHVKCLSIILNDIDDLVHGQLQGRVGMYNDIKFLASSGKIQGLIFRLYHMGFNIYLTSDHGNTICTGLGMLKGMGIEVETKSKRMLILKDFANSSEIIDKYNLIEYPGYYLDKQYKYYICNTGTSFDIKDSEVMTHGGITIDEVIVPFIKIMAVQNG